MKSFLSSLAILATSLSLLGGADSADGPSCQVTGTSNDTFFSVVGVQGTGVHPRLELRQLEKKPEMWNLFLQALARFQAMDQNNKLSFYQVAGIHGFPARSWDSVPGEGEYGYCPHGSNVFGTWHRPYLALFEQVLHDRALEIADEFPEGQTKQKHQEAANALRLPFWDWAIDPPSSAEGCMPASLRQPTANVMLPNGTNATIPNPLYQYAFHPLNPSDFDPLTQVGFKYSDWKTTIRFPLDGLASNATSRNDDVNNRITAQQANNRDMLYKLLTIYQPFNEWSNKANGGKIGNIETLHDGIHNSFGLGHMGLPEVGGFDPVFWFHHSNIDRIIAIYQHRYPDTYVEAAAQAKATYYMKKDSIQNAASPLAPFHMNAKGDMWTSTTSRNWESFGYTYPELEGNPTNESLTLQINRLYRPQTQGLVNSTASAKIKRQAQDNEKADAIDWMAEVNMPSDIQITYSVRAFLGAPDKDPKNWPTDKNYVGQVASLASPRMDSDVIVTANIVLTDRLAEKFQAGELKSLERDEVQQYLEKNFNWRIQQVDLTEIPRSLAPPSLNVTVLSVPVHLPQSELEVPTFAGDFEYHPEIHGNPPPENEDSVPTQSLLANLPTTAIETKTAVVTSFVTVAPQ